MKAEERKNSWGYGNIPQTEEEFYKRLDSQIKALKNSKHVVGFCYNTTYRCGTGKERSLLL